MARRLTVTFAESAVGDLEDLRAWYTGQGVPDVAARFVAGVIERVEQISAFPESGRVVPEFETPWLRELIYPSFRIVYRIGEDRVRVVRIWRSERLMLEP